MNLNPEQKLAASHFNGPCIVTSVPGSGKTSTLTARVINLINNKVNPRNILCLTFTNKAANEMKERVTHHIGEQASQVWISTFHSFFLAILRKHGNLIGLPPNFSLYDEKDQLALLEKVARMRECEINSAGISFLAKVANDCRENLEDLSDNADLSDEHKEIIKEYFSCLKEFNAVDFSGILHYTYAILKNNEPVRKALADRFQFILGDEWQDTNTIQYEVIKMIASHQNLFVVADPQQSIFEFRGAKPENLNKMKRDFINTKEITLLRNYRSTSNILKCAQSLIRKNHDAKSVELISVHGQGSDVNFCVYASPEYESTGIANRIMELKDQYGYKWNDFAILYRSNMLSKVPEMTFRRMNVPYKIYGGFSFFDRSEIKTSLAYLSFLANAHDTIAFSRCIQTPKRQIGPSVIGKLERVCQDHKISILAACKKADLIDGISKSARKSLDDFLGVVEKYRHTTGKIGKTASEFLKEVGYYDYMKTESEKDADFKRRVDNIDELLLSVSDYELQKPNPTLSDYLHSVEIMTSDTKESDEDSVSLLTMHSAKGLEWKAGFIIGAEQGIIPHKRSLAEGNIQEERRLMYVATTRFQKHLDISYCENRRSFSTSAGAGKSNSCVPSMFIRELLTT